jgi:hypothetical protein
MIFPDYDRIFTYAILIGMILIAFWAYRFVGPRRPSIRIPVRIISLFVIPFNLLLTILVLSFQGCVTRTPPIFSPDRQRAIRIENADEGATGGETYVIIYSNGGLSTETVFSGNWASVQPKNVHWMNDEEVWIGFRNDDPDAKCEGAKSIQVHCERIGSDSRQAVSPLIKEPNLLTGDIMHRQRPRK